MENFLAILSGGGVTLLIVALFLAIGDLAAAYLPASRRQQLRCLMFVLTGMAALKYPLYVEGDILLDQRGAILAISALFGGAPAVLATGAAMLAFRFYIGGSGMAAGLLGIGGTMAVCALLMSWWRGRHGSRRPDSVLVLIAGMTAGLCSALTLLLVPGKGWKLFMHEATGLFLVQVVTTCLFGFLLKLQAERQHGIDELETKNGALREALLQAVGALSMAMAHRDPGVAGHEKRVAALAQAIGAELGLEAERLEGLKLAALVHDIGKLQLPAEILMRPRKLSAEEFDSGQAARGERLRHSQGCPFSLAAG